jgi:hypothetical protein
LIVVTRKGRFGVHVDKKVIMKTKTDGTYIPEHEADQNLLMSMLKQYVEPEHAVVGPSADRTHGVDAGWFVLVRVVKQDGQHVDYFDGGDIKHEHLRYARLMAVDGKCSVEIRDTADMLTL